MLNYRTFHKYPGSLLIGEVYGVTFLAVDNRDKACWSDVQSRVSSKHNIAEHRLIEDVEYLVDNIVDNRVCRQCVGIPMGMPLVANHIILL